MLCRSISPARGSAMRLQMRLALLCFAVSQPNHGIMGSLEETVLPFESESYPVVFLLQCRLKSLSRINTRGFPCWLSDLGDSDDRIFNMLFSSLFPGLAVLASLASCTILQNGQVRITNYPNTVISLADSQWKTYPASANEVSYKGRWDSKFVSWWS
jgi:hypothetical protein